MPDALRVANHRVGHDVPDLRGFLTGAIPQPSSCASSVALPPAAAVLMVAWAHFPRSSWLAAASMAAIASLALRFVGADVAPGLSLLAVIALGSGGAFASAVTE